VILLKVRNPLLVLGAATIFVLMSSCLFGSLLLFVQSSGAEQIQPAEKNLIIMGLAGAQQTLLGLATVTALLSVSGPLFLIYVERTLNDQPITWRERPRAALIGILTYAPVMLFWLFTPYSEISRAIALVNYSSQESILTASIVKTFALTFAPVWALIIAIFILSFIKIVKASQIPRA